MLPVAGVAVYFFRPRRACGPATAWRQGFLKSYSSWLRQPGAHLDEVMEGREASFRAGTRCVVWHRFHVALIVFKRALLAMPCFLSRLFPSPCSLTPSRVLRVRPQAKFYVACRSLNDGHPRPASLYLAGP